tara:strand:+ start:290 stop:442 length:153 start_codon:yes stop_codon:yes gene_type:complete
MGGRAGERSVEAMEGREVKVLSAMRREIGFGGEGLDDGVYDDDEYRVDDE